VELRTMNPYGGISIKTQKSEYEKIRIFNAFLSIEKCATLNDK
jgi:hypothetical protein